ncbi:alpha/beta hydrolase-fold protein [Branchiibius sp. NY16-3462-2]|uniref:alpha/beta hydrolase n=1 Tax=Branchiibius sp. NY16-3462-2 TaxID=1807500 RepID=UPI000799B653|nr:alpha/beta hydrolase-fold protein [Branchiibius sp. NY16-3462-2]KYH42930.1 hypothetical protein AZH51_01235 [Branchiibius sp. NY16-3462-2]
MEPDSGALVALCWIVAILAIIGSVVLGVQLTKRNPLTFVIRLVAQVVTCALAVLAVAATLNAQNDWYADWADLGNDLVGNGLPAGTVEQAGMAVRNFNPAQEAATNRTAEDRYGAERKHEQASLHLIADPGQGGQEVTVQIPGRGDGAVGEVKVWLPQAYTNPAQQTRTFPVIEAFQGIPATDNSWFKVAHLGETIGQLAAEHELNQAIVVSPEVTPGGLDTECVNGGGRYEMETWLTKEIPEWIVQHFRASADRNGWATIGYSAGAWCAIMAATLHPQTYGAAIVLGGYFQPLWGKWRPFKKTPAKYNVLATAEHHSPPISVWIEVSGKDTLSGPRSQQFVKYAKPPMAVTSVTYPDAGHRFSVWMAAYPHALLWLSHALPQFAPNSTDAVISSP